MRDKPSEFLEQCRKRDGIMGSGPEYGNNGAFIIPRGATRLRVIVSDGGGWEHVSVTAYELVKSHTRTRIPTWEEMCYVKGLFWEDDETVVQYHPAKADYVNMHPMCLHLWRPMGGMLPTPPLAMV